MKFALITMLLSASQQDVDAERIRAVLAIETAIRQISQQQAEIQVEPVVDDQQPKAKTYQEAYDEAYEAGLSLVVGIDLAPPKGQDWVGVQVKAPWHGQRSGFVVSSPPVDGHLLWTTSLPADAGVNDIVDAIAIWKARQSRRKQVRQAESC